jgi:hypothetical protein
MNPGTPLCTTVFGFGEIRNECSEPDSGHRAVPVDKLNP